MRGRQPGGERVGKGHVPRARALGAVRPEGPARVAWRRQRARRVRHPEPLDALARQPRDAPVARATAHVHERERAARAPHQRQLGPPPGVVRSSARFRRRRRNRRDVQNRPLDVLSGGPERGAARFAQRRARSAAQTRRARDCHLVQHRLGARAASARAGRGGTRGERDEQERPVRVHGERRRGKRRVQQHGGGVQVVLRVDAERVRRRVLVSVPIERVARSIDRPAFRIAPRVFGRVVVAVAVAVVVDVVVSAPAEPVEPRGVPSALARPARASPRRRLDHHSHDVAHPRGGDGDERLLLRHVSEDARLLGLEVHQHEAPRAGSQDVRAALARAHQAGRAVRAHVLARERDAACAGSRPQRRSAVSVVFVSARVFVRVFVRVAREDQEAVRARQNARRGALPVAEVRRARGRGRRERVLQGARVRARSARRARRLRFAFDSSLSRARRGGGKDSPAAASPRDALHPERGSRFLAALLIRRRGVWFPVYVFATRA